VEVAGLSGKTIPVRIGGIEVLVESTPVAGTQATSKASDAADHVVDAFDRAKETILEIAASTAGLIEDAARRGARPDQLQVEFGLKFSVQGNIIVAGATAEAALVVRLTYDAPPPA
jgi:Trypsin-co-occurring domain 1